MRSRLVGRDLRLPLLQLQAAAGQQAEAVVALAQRLERLEGDVRGAGALPAACYCLLLAG